MKREIARRVNVSQSDGQAVEAPACRCGGRARIRYSSLKWFEIEPTLVLVAACSHGEPRATWLQLPTSDFDESEASNDDRAPAGLERRTTPSAPISRTSYAVDPGHGLAAKAALNLNFDLRAVEITTAMAPPPQSDIARSRWMAR